ncbi:response regulator [Tolypothrix campylonemoides VB511288_2]|nr:response regulator [Tolypothrix bouteillei]
MCAWGKTHKPEYEFGYLRLQGLHVLIVSSETAVRDLLQRMIEERAARVIAVGNITAALTAVEQMQLDALIVDIRGLGEESYRLIQQIKSVEAVQRRQIPAIALTRSDADRGRAIHEGYAVHIAEPFEPVELVAILASLTSRPD